jgi:hypothetical protein
MTETTMLTRRMLLCLAPVFFAGGVLCAYEEPQPHMRLALRTLPEAKAAPAVATLLKARKQLEKASHDKGGHRTRAIDAVDLAIRALNQGSKQMAVTRIEQAIVQAEKGVRFDVSH